MKFGVFDHVDCSGSPLGEHLGNRIRLVEVFDRCGFHGYHVAEHHGTPLGLAPSPNILLSAIAQRTRRIKIGTLVYMLPLYHPLRLIEEVCMLDHLSEGRLMLGVGRGVSPFELGFYGVDVPDAQARYTEVFDCVMQGLHEERLTFAGKYFSFHEVPMTLRPLQQPHPELWYGVLNPDTTVWAAANDVNLVTLALAEGTRAIVERYRAEWAKLGKPADRLPLVGVSRHVVVAETDAEARAIARRAYRRWLSGFGKLWRDNGLPVPFIATLYPAEWDDLQAIGNGCAGSPETVRRYVLEEAEKSGLNYFISWFAFGDMNFAEVKTSAELFSRAVMPAFGAPTAAAS